jgi:hypothetical protein
VLYTTLKSGMQDWSLMISLSLTSSRMQDKVRTKHKVPLGIEAETDLMRSRVYRCLRPDGPERR